jgi:hypothetical protein
MKPFNIKRTDARDLKFTGELLSSAESSANDASGSYSGSVGRWTELNLYLTKAGKYVCQRISYTKWLGERDSYEAGVHDTAEAVFDFFGGGWLAKELYTEAGLDTSETVE